MATSIRSYIHLKTNKHIFWYYFICFLHKFYECSPYYPKHFQPKCYFCLPKILHETLVIKDLHMKSNMTQNYLTNNRHICIRETCLQTEMTSVSVGFVCLKCEIHQNLTWSKSCQSKSLFFLWSIFYFLDNQLINV